MVPVIVNPAPQLFIVMPYARILDVALRIAPIVDLVAGVTRGMGFGGHRQEVICRLSKDSLLDFPIQAVREDVREWG